MEQLHGIGPGTLACNSHVTETSRHHNLTLACKQFTYALTVQDKPPTPTLWLLIESLWHKGVQ